MEEQMPWSVVLGGGGVGWGVLSCWDFSSSFPVVIENKKHDLLTLKALPQWAAAAGKTKVPVPTFLALH